MATRIEGGFSPTCAQNFNMGRTLEKASAYLVVLAIGEIYLEEIGVLATSTEHVSSRFEAIGQKNSQIVYPNRDFGIDNTQEFYGGFIFSRDFCDAIKPMEVS